MATCFNCGSEIIWNADFMSSELGFTSDDEDQDTCVNVCSCPCCHATIYVVHESEADARERIASEGAQPII